MNVKDIAEQLKPLILTSLQIDDLTPADLGDEYPLLDGELEIDSVDILQLVLDVERHFGIRLVTAGFDRDAWKTVSTLAAAINEKLEEKAQSQAPS